MCAQIRIYSILTAIPHRYHLQKKARIRHFGSNDMEIYRWIIRFHIPRTFLNTWHPLISIKKRTPRTPDRLKMYLRDI